MKRLVYIVGVLIMCILFLVLQLTIHGKTERRTELNNTLNSTVEATISTLMKEKSYSIASYDEFLADFIQNLSISLDSDSDIKVDVLKADKDKGLLAVRVEQHYTHLNGNPGKESCIKVVVFENITKPEIEQITYAVKFFRTKEDLEADTNCYKTYKIAEGDMPVKPIISEKGKIFSSWVDKDGNIADFTQAITENKAYYAVFN